MKVLILAHRWDVSAARLAAELRRPSPRLDVRLVTLDELILAPRWSHRLDHQKVTSEVTLHDGTTLGGGEIGVVFNRLAHMEMPHFAFAREADRDYAHMEMFALLLSWLAGLPCPVVNPVRADGLGCIPLQPAQWLTLATRAGLPTPRARITTSARRFPVRGMIPTPSTMGLNGHAPHSRVVGIGPAWYREPGGVLRCSVFVAGNEVVGSVGSELSNACLHLAELSGLQILEIHFSNRTRDHDWVFAGASSFPNLTRPAVLQVTARFLRSLAGSRE